MRTLVDIGDEDVAALDEAARREGVSRAALIRRAIAGFLDQRKSADLGDAFGLWRGHAAPVDGVTFQERARKEW